jgi:NACalpha-BTF3-like transcription factor
MSQKQTSVTFAVDAKPPNYGPMKLHTKLNKCKKYAVEYEYDGSMPIPLIDYGVPAKQYDIFSGEDYTFGGVNKEEKDIRLVMFQTGATRELVIETLRKHDGDIVNAIMEL